MYKEVNEKKNKTIHKMKNERKIHTNTFCEVEFHFKN